MVVFQYNYNNIITMNTKWTVEQHVSKLKRKLDRLKMKVYGEDDLKCYIRVLHLNQQLLIADYKAASKGAISWLDEISNLKSNMEQNNLKQKYNKYFHYMTSGFAIHLLVHNLDINFYNVVLDNWLNAIEDVPEEVRLKAFGVRLTIFSELVTFIKNIGNYSTQLNLFQIFMRYTRAQPGLLSDILGAPQLEKMILTMNRKNFFEKCRQCLNILNKENNLVISHQANAIFIDRLEVFDPAQKTGLWVDVNLKTNTITFLFDGTCFPNIDTQNWIVCTIEAKNIRKISYEKINPEEFVIKILLRRKDILSNESYNNCIKRAYILMIFPDPSANGNENPLMNEIIRNLPVASSKERKFLKFLHLFKCLNENMFPNKNMNSFFHTDTSTITNNNHNNITKFPREWSIFMDSSIQDNTKNSSELITADHNQKIDELYQKNDDTNINVLIHKENIRITNCDDMYNIINSGISPVAVENAKENSIIIDKRGHTKPTVPLINENKFFHTKETTMSTYESKIENSKSYSKNESVFKPDIEINLLKNKTENPKMKSRTSPNFRQEKTKPVKKIAKNVCDQSKKQKIKNEDKEHIKENEFVTLVEDVSFANEELLTNALQIYIENNGPSGVATMLNVSNKPEEEIKQVNSDMQKIHKMINRSSTMLFKKKDHVDPKYDPYDMRYEIGTSFNQCSANKKGNSKKKQTPKLNKRNINKSLSNSKKRRSKNVNFSYKHHVQTKQGYTTQEVNICINQDSGEISLTKKAVSSNVLDSTPKTEKPKTLNTPITSCHKTQTNIETAMSSLKVKQSKKPKIVTDTKFATTVHTTSTRSTRIKKPVIYVYSEDDTENKYVQKKKKTQNKNVTVLKDKSINNSVREDLNLDVTDIPRQKNKNQLNVSVPSLNMSILKNQTYLETPICRRSQYLDNDIPVKVPDDMKEVQLYTAIPNKNGKTKNKKNTKSTLNKRTARSRKTRAASKKTTNVKNKISVNKQNTNVVSSGNERLLNVNKIQPQRSEVDEMPLNTKFNSKGNVIEVDSVPEYTVTPLNIADAKNSTSLQSFDKAENIIYNNNSYSAEPICNVINNPIINMDFCKKNWLLQKFMEMEPQDDFSFCTVDSLSPIRGGKHSERMNLSSNIEIPVTLDNKRKIHLQNYRHSTPIKYKTVSTSPICWIDVEQEMSKVKPKATKNAYIIENGNKKIKFTQLKNGDKKNRKNIENEEIELSTPLQSPLKNSTFNKRRQSELSTTSSEYSISSFNIGEMLDEYYDQMYSLIQTNHQPFLDNLQVSMENFKEQLHEYVYSYTQRITTYNQECAVLPAKIQKLEKQLDEEKNKYHKILVEMKRCTNNYIDKLTTSNNLWEALKQNVNEKWDKEVQDLEVQGAELRKSIWQKCVEDTAKQFYDYVFEVMLQE